MSDKKSKNRCDYIKKNGSLCGRKCIKKQCAEHINKKAYAQCKGPGCDQMTIGKYGYCTVCGVARRREQRLSAKVQKDMIEVEISDIDEDDLEEMMEKLILEKREITKKIRELRDEIVGKQNARLRVIEKTSRDPSEDEYEEEPEEEKKDEKPKPKPPPKDEKKDEKKEVKKPPKPNPLDWDQGLIKNGQYYYRKPSKKL